jgi:hypothetical protein
VEMVERLKIAFSNKTKKLKLTSSQGKKQRKENIGFT